MVETALHNFEHVHSCYCGVAGSVADSAKCCWGFGMWVQQARATFRWAARTFWICTFLGVSCTTDTASGTAGCMTWEGQSLAVAVPLFTATVASILWQVV